MMAIIWSWALNNKGLAAAVLALVISLGTNGWQSLDRALLRADLAAARSEIAAVAAGREAYRRSAELELQRLAQRERGRSDNFKSARGRFEHEQSATAAITDHDRAVLDCLHQLRSGRACAAP